jgi:probable F420-dependent oxidoreductase
VKFGGPLPWSGQHATCDNIRAFAPLIEDAGYDWITAGEHLFYPKDLRTPHPRTGKLPLDPSRYSQEIFTLFSWIAGFTTTIRLMSSMVIVPYRSPFVTAKLATGVDYLSDGRFVLGAAGGWMVEEFEALHLPFDERGAIMDEYLTIITAIFAGDGAVPGRFCSLPEAWIEPKPVQKPLPIVIGGRAVGAIMRRVATFGHGWWPYPMDATQIAAAMPRMRTLWQKAGRGDESLEVHSYLRVPLDPTTGQRTVSREALLGQIAALADAGVTHITMTFDELGSPAGTAPLAAVVEAAQWFAADVMPTGRAIGEVSSTNLVIG